MGQARQQWIGVLCGLGAALLIPAACSESVSDPSDPIAPAVVADAPRLLTCAPARPVSARGLVGRAGGRLMMAGHTMSLPVSAVRNGTSFTMTVPASRLVEVNIKANGREKFAFDEPVTISISYARCAPDEVPEEGLTVWKIDPRTKVPLKPMGGVQDPVARTVTFVTDSLSSYAIAN